MNIVHGHVMPHLAATKSFAARRRETEPKGSPAGSEFYARAGPAEGFFRAFDWPVMVFERALRASSLVFHFPFEMLDLSFAISDLRALSVAIGNFFLT